LTIVAEIVAMFMILYTPGSRTGINNTFKFK